MRYYFKQDTSMSLLLACLFSTLPGCSPDVSRSVGPESPVAAFAVLVDSSTLRVGHLAQASIAATDMEGKAVQPAVAWTSLTPDIAAVSTSGMVTAIASGEAIIEGNVAGSTARGKLTVFAQPDLASHNFNDGTLGAFSNPSKLDLDFPSDPTSSGRGKVARFHYKGSYGDQNRSLEFTHARRWGEPIYFRGEFFLPLDDLGAHGIIRKLIYWQSNRDYGKYPGNGGLATGRTVVLLSGTDLVVDATYNPAAGTGKSSDDVRTVATLADGLRGNTWYTLEVYQRLESAIGRADGVLQVWLDGKLVFNSSTMTWSDPAWVGDMSSGVPFDAADIYFKHFRVGDQVNWNEGSFDEFRYWDNVEFSTHRIDR